MTEQGTGSTVLLAGKRASPAFLDRLAREGGRVERFESMRELLRDRGLPEVAVLMIRAEPLPQGVPLALLAWMNLEYPSVQKVAVVAGPLPLPLARYLTACGVDLVWAQSDGSLDEVIAVLDRMHARSGWIAPWVRPLSSRAELENDHERA